MNLELFTIFAGWDYSDNSLLEKIVLLGVVFLVPIAILFLVIGLITKKKTILKTAAATFVLWIICLLMF